MDSQLRSQVLFHLTGRLVEADPDAALPAGLRPALMAPYRRLDALRHDFPLVLADGDGEYVAGLSAAVDGALRAAAVPGTPGEGMRRRALGVERLIRRRVMAGQRGSLLEHWDAAVGELAAGATDAAFRKEMACVREALPLDGSLVDCDAGLPSTFVRHAWRVVQREKCRAARERIERVLQRLEAIVRADEARSPEANAPARLQETFGAAHRNLFDFAAMSRLLNQPGPRGGLPEARRRRIMQVLECLRSQRLFPADGEAGFACTSTGEALDEFLRRLPDMVALHKALQVGELEADGRYVEEMHDPVFEALDERSLSAEDLRAFPDLLVCVSATARGSNAALVEALATGVPLKVLVEVDDVLEPSASFGTSLGFGLRESQLATSAMSLGEAFVLQTVASNLLQVRDEVQRGLRHAGATLFCVYAGPPAASAGSLPTYLVTAAALQSRAFPTFCYDPRAGADLAARFSLAGNPQPDADWPGESFTYADADLQSVTETIPFTFLDFALCDPRHANHFAVVPRARWGDGFVPAAQWLAEPPTDVSSALPYLLAVDDADLLCRLVVDERLARAALRCRDAWRRLQELGGVRDSRLEQAIAREREQWQARLERELAARDPAPTSGPASVAPPDAITAPAPAPGAPLEEPPRNPDEAYVETLRCSSCNECTLAFPKLFAYDDQKQAFLKDARAGSYRQLVEAAEACQVSVIHPGKPWDPNEPGLEELIERARPFL